MDLFQFMESRHGYDMYASSYNGEHYVIQYDPESGQIEQMRPINYRLASLFENFISG